MGATLSDVSLEEVTYQPGSETYRFAYDQDATRASLAVVAALAEITDTDPTTLAPLYDAVDVDALDALVRASDTGDGDVHVAWTHEGYAFTVHSYGMITVAPAEGERPEDWSEGVSHR